MKSVIMTDEEVRGILSGRKRAHVIPMWPQPSSDFEQNPDYNDVAMFGDGRCGFFDGVRDHYSPLGAVGDRFKVREMWDSFDNIKFYKADIEPEHIVLFHWKSPAIMPAAFVRTTPLITAVKVVQAQELTEDVCELFGLGKHGGWDVDEKVNGINYRGPFSHYYTARYARQIAKHPQLAWGENPELWYYTFEKGEYM